MALAMYYSGCWCFPHAAFRRVLGTKLAGVSFYPAKQPGAVSLSRCSAIGVRCQGSQEEVPMGVRDIHMGLEGLRGDLCLSLDLGTHPRAIQPPKHGIQPKESWVAPWVRSPWAARHQEHVEMPGHGVGPVSAGDSCPSRCSQTGRMFSGKC